MIDENEPARAKIKKFYDQEYYIDARDQNDLPWHYKEIVDRLGNLEGAQVLDIACGTGKWLEYLASKGAAASGIDISERAIAACQERMPTSDIRVGIAEDLPFQDASFDVITCMGSLEHFLEPHRAIAEMRRVGKEKARYLILVPNSGFLPRRLGLYGGTDQVKVREVVRSLREWDALFSAAGLRVLERWRDLHMLSFEWIFREGRLRAPIRAAQALSLPVWPLAWQYQVHHYCSNDIS